MEHKEKLKVSDIHKSYGDNIVLRGVSLTANAGDVISIIGSSGSGKSTFLRCINMLEKPNQGTIALNGETLNLKASKTGELVASDSKNSSTSAMPIMAIRPTMTGKRARLGVWATRSDELFSGFMACWPRAAAAGF